MAPVDKPMHALRKEFGTAGCRHKSDWAIGKNHFAGALTLWFPVWLAIYSVACSCQLSSTGVLIREDQKEAEVYRAAAEPSTANEVYGQGVRETPWLSPADEQRGFHLPDGFVAELVASEPQITKPLNMAFDAHGRLWVTCTVEYPYAAPEGQIAKDTIRVLEDTDKDGNFDKVTTFADQLNIPIGILPISQGVICFSIPNLWLLQDTDGDGKADQRTKLLGPFDTSRDTHGMVNALRQGSDGWIYACHGFNNRSKVTAADGSTVELNSGNTFRFLPDGSRIEQFTSGQVNPFGMCCDEWGNWYTADCHSKPLTGLLAGACYPSFGRPHDGLGFAPSMMDHLHGSTAICGVEYYQAEQFPKPFRNLFFSGNVMTSRINCNAIERRGATVIARELGDFMTSDDPWFRPVDIIQGPDGALYVADFYNKIIGHYEVPLTHPDRDRTSGRIWRIRYKAGSKNQISTHSHDAQQRATNLLQRLESSNYQMRRLAIETALQSNAEGISSQQMSVSLGNDALRQFLASPSSNSFLRLSAIEILNRRSALSNDLLVELLQNASAPAEQVLLLRIVSGRTQLGTSNDQPQSQSGDSTGHVHDQHLLLANIVSKCVSTGHPEVVKAAVDALGRCGNTAHMSPLTALLKDLPAEDLVLRQAVRIALRNILARDASALQQFVTRIEDDSPWTSSKEAELLAGVLPGIPSLDASTALLKYVASRGLQVDTNIRTAAIEHATRFPNPNSSRLLMQVVEAATQDSPLLRSELILQIARAYTSVNRQGNSQLIEVANRTLQELIQQIQRAISLEGPSMQWIDQDGKLWASESRKCADGVSVQLVSSLTRGEKYTGRLDSEPFACPDRLSFWLAGHNGHPDKSDQRRNYVALVNPLTGQVLLQALPPRSDTAKEVQWDTSRWVGQRVQLRVVDGDDGDAFAWLGVSRFSLDGLQIGSTEGLLRSVAELLQLGLGNQPIVDQLASAPLSPRQRVAILAAWYNGHGSPWIGGLASQALSVGRTDLFEDISVGQSWDQEKLTSLMTELCRSVPASRQSGMAKMLLTSEPGCELLEQALQQGLLSTGALRGTAPVFPGQLDESIKKNLLQFFNQAEASGLDVKVVGQRLSRLNWSSVDVSRGRELFTQQCANCHQLAGQGAVIGPQLDGAIQRNVERLSEDILLPNLNVDKAFRVTTFLMEDGSVISGLVRDENDSLIQIIGSDAKVQTLDVSAIEQRKESELSLMPANFGEILSDQQLADLLHYLGHSARR